ncbi:unnamed protein product [Ectocarpus sp. CCAP 1310/34]|nr:unnamed protein product [Ectocarpus sp. CCAP 1310/34]
MPVCRASAAYSHCTRSDFLKVATKFAYQASSIYARTGMPLDRRLQAEIMETRAVV